LKKTKAIMLAQHSIKTANFAQQTAGKAISKRKDMIMMKDNLSFLESDLFSSDLFSSDLVKTQAPCMGNKKDVNSFGMPSSDKTKAQARRMVRDVILDENKKVQDLNKLVEYYGRLKAAREASQNKVGVLLSNRQIQKFQAKKHVSVQTIQELELLMKEISDSEFVENYAHRAAAIVERNISHDPPARRALTSRLVKRPKH
jgi:hypothetical protein